MKSISPEKDSLKVVHVGGDAICGATSRHWIDKFSQALYHGARRSKASFQHAFILGLDYGERITRPSGHHPPNTRENRRSRQKDTPASGTSGRVR